MRCIQRTIERSTGFDWCTAVIFVGKTTCWWCSYGGFKYSSHTRHDRHIKNTTYLGQNIWHWSDLMRGFCSSALEETVCLLPTARCSQDTCRAIPRHASQTQRRFQLTESILISSQRTTTPRRPKHRRVVRTRKQNTIHCTHGRRTLALQLFNVTHDTHTHLEKVKVKREGADGASNPKPRRNR